MSMLSNIGSALRFAKLELTNAGINEPDLSAQILLAYVSGLSRQQLYARFDDVLSEDQQLKFKHLISRRIDNEPIQYILGHTHFRGLKINVGPGVLIPRPETEYLVEQALKQIDKPNPKIIDLCTGSGCCAISIAKVIKDSKIFAYDISEDALNYAKQNSKINNTGDIVEFVQADIFEFDDFPTDIDMIVSNPPYVPRNVLYDLTPEVKSHEPMIALRAGDDGNSFVPRIAEIAINCLKPGGVLCIELFEDSLEKAAEILKSYKLKNIEIKKDLADKTRYIFAQK